MAEALRMEAIVVDRFSPTMRKLRDDLRSIRSPQNLKGLKGDFEALGSAVQKSAGLIQTGLIGALSGVGIAAIGAGGAIAGVVAAVRRFGDVTTEMKALSTETGLSIQQMRVLEAAAPRFALSADKMRSGVRAFAANMFEMRRGRGPFVDLMAGQASDLANGLKEFAKKGDVSKGLSMAFQYIEDEAKKNPQNARKLSQLLFGGPDFARVKDSFKVLQQASKEVKPFSEDDLRRGEAYHSAVTKLQTAFENLQLTVGVKLAPALTLAANDLARFLDEKYDSIAEGIGKAITEMGKALKGIDWVEIGRGVAGFFGLLKELYKVIKAISDISADAGAFFGVRAPRDGAPSWASSGSNATGAKREKLAETDKWLEKNGDGSGPAVDGMRRQRKALADEINQQESSGLSFGAPGAGVKMPNGLDTAGGGAAAARVPPVFRNSNAFFDSIIKAEGTGKGGRDPYNTTLGFGRYGQPSKPLTEMTLAEVYRFGQEVIRPRHRAEQGGRGSSATGAFQIVGETMRTYMKTAGLTWGDKYSPENQRKLAAVIARAQGLGAWEGFKVHPDQRARAADAMRRGDDQVAPGSAYRAAQDAGAMGGAGPDGKAVLDINVNGFPKGWRARADGGDLFREVNVNRGKNMSAPGADE